MVLRLIYYGAYCLFMAAAGVVIMTVGYGEAPWISPALAILFALYGLFKKLGSTDSAIGFLQYLTPIINLTIGVFLFREPFTKENFVSFGFIWCALAIYSVPQIAAARRNRAVPAVE